MKQRVAGSIPSQGTCLGCGPGPQLGVQERQPYIDVSLSLSLPLSIKINKILKKKRKRQAQLGWLLKSVYSYKTFYRLS